MDIKETTQRIQENVARVIVGKDEVIELCLVALLCEGHVLLEDVPGIGKTTLARAIARSLGCSFKRIQFTPDLLPSDVTGIYYFNQKHQEFEFRAGPIISQVVLADEINRATPRTQSALLEAMQERQVTVDVETIPLPRLPEAQVDRFLLRLALGYPSEEDENTILLRYERQDPMDALEPAVTVDELLAMQEQIRSVMVEESVRQYIVSIVRATREHEAVELGVSPRGTLSLYRTAQALAALRGRTFVIPDDVKYLVPSVLTHRIIISPQTRLRGRRPEEVVMEIVDTVPVPVEE